MNLVLRRTWPDDPHSTQDFIVAVAGTQKSLARMMLITRSDHRKIWSWSIYGFIAPGIGGQSDTLEEAKAETKAHVMRLLDAGTPQMPEPAKWRPGSAFQTVNNGLA
jgi:hypothetical protein